MSYEDKDLEQIRRDLDAAGVPEEDQQRIIKKIVTSSTSFAIVCLGVIAVTFICGAIWIATHTFQLCGTGG